MGRIRRVASVATITAALAVTGFAAVPAARAGLEAEPTAPPAAYVSEIAAPPFLCVLSSLDLATGDTAPLGAAPSAEACVIDLAVAPDGSIWGVGPIPTDGTPEVPYLTHFDQTTGEVLSSGPFTGAFDEVLGIYGGIAFDGAGTLYAQLVTDEPGCDDNFVCLYTVDPATGASTLVGAPGDDYARTSLIFLAADCGTAMDTTEPTIFEDLSTESGWDDPAVTGHDDADSLARYDRTTAALSEVAHFADPDTFTVGLDYARADGTLYALTAPRTIPGEAGEPIAQPSGDVGVSAILVSLYTVDPATAAVTLVAPLDPEANVVGLGIAGTCPVPPAPIVLEPTFTG